MSSVANSPQRLPHHLVVQTGGDEFPVSPPVPELSWQLPAHVETQAGYDLEARVGGEVLRHSSRSSRHRFVKWPFRPLGSSETVSWRVRIAEPGAASDWSEWSRFEAGLFDADWTAQWITAPEPTPAPLGDRPAYRFSVEVNVSQLPDTARLYSSAFGVYDALINGRRVGRAELSPGSQSYDKTIYAQAFDASPHLRLGLNTVEIVVSDGWYRGRTGAFRKQAEWGVVTAIRAELHLDGRVVSVTDTEWQVERSTILQADLMDGQTQDLTARSVSLGAALPFTSPVPPITWSPAAPVRVVEELSPLRITRLSADVAVVDFGQNASGRVRLSSLGPAGTATTLDFGEHVRPDGDLTLAHLNTPSPDGTIVEFRQRDIVISDGDPEARFEPHHTVHGFRYVRVERSGLDLSPDDIRMQVMHTDLERVGSFSCDDTDLVRLYDVAEWSFRGNAVDVPTDCPTRERAGWTGDWQIFLPTAVRLFDVDGFSRKWLQSVRDDQLHDGRIVNVSPDHARLNLVPDPMSDMATGSAGWGDAIVLVPWELYRTYGDDAVLRDSWESMRRWVQFALDAAASKRHPSRIERSATPLPHEQYLWDGTFHFGEWCEPTPLAEDGTPGPMMPDPLAWAMSDKGEVGTAYLYRTTATLARIADVLGHEEESAEYSRVAESIRDAWQIEFLDARTARTLTDTQAAYVRALAFDLVPNDLRPAVADRLVELIRDADMHLGTGFLSTPDLLPVLADTGHADIAHALLLQRTTPSWLGMIDRGATTIWEEWEGVDRNGRAHASLNHYSKGAVIRYLQTHTLGIRQDVGSTAWESFTVAPVVPEHLNWARGHFDSPQGRIQVRWERDSTSAVLQVTVPGGSRATVLWGEEHREFGPGSHELRTSRESLPLIHAAANTPSSATSNR